MRVGVDARIASMKRNGWGRYAERLLVAMATSCPELDLHILLADSELGREIAARQRGFPSVRVYPTSFSETDPNRYWTTGGEDNFPEHWFGPVDVLHSLTRFVAPTQLRPVLASVHDVAPLSDPPFKLEYKESTLRCLQAIADLDCHLIASSHFTKDELQSRAGVDTPRIDVVHLGVTEFARRNTAPSSPLREISDYVLYVGDAGENKNLETLIQAMVRVRATRPCPLVLVGEYTSRHERTIGEAVREFDWIHAVGYISEDGMWEVYHGALMAVHPSLHEGFGLPLLEAMSCGCPVVASRIPVFQELALDAAVYADPYSEVDMANRIRAVAQDPDLRSLLIEKGMARAGAFSWERTALETQAMYRSVAERHVGAV